MILQHGDILQWVTLYQNQIRHRTLTTIWQQTDQLIVSAGVEPGDRIVTTALPYAPEGMQVKVSKAESSLAKP